MFRHLFFAACCALLMGPFWSTQEAAGVLANLERMKTEIHQDRCSRNSNCRAISAFRVPGKSGAPRQLTRTMR